MKTVTLFVGLIWAHSSFAQTDQSVVLEDLLINASTVPVVAPQVGSSVSVISAEQLQARGVHYVADALRQVPGLSVNRAGGFGGLTQLRIRGAEGNHVLVLVDGVEVAPADTGELDLSSVAVSDIERIEVLRGPQSGLYGSNALAGVIAITTRSPQPGRRVTLDLETGSFESQQVAASVTGGNTDANAALSVSRRREAGLNNARAGSEEDDNELTALSARGQWLASSSSSVSAALRWVEKDSETDPQDFTGGPFQGQIIDGAESTSTRDLDLALGLDLSAGRLRHKLDLSHVDTRLDGQGGFGAFGSDTARSRAAWQTTALLSDARGSYVSGFVELERESFRNRYPSDPSQQPEFDRDLAALGVEYRTRVGDALHLAASVRTDFNDAFDDATTARLTAAWLFSGERRRLHASVGRGVTNPTFYEQFGFTPGFFVGNPELGPETSVAWDLGLEQRWAAGAVVTDLTLFAADLSDEIVAAFPSVVNAPGHSDRRGLEASLQGQWADHWNLALSYTYTDSEQPDGQAELRVPEHVGAIDLGYAFANMRTRLHLGITHNGSQLDADFGRFFSNGFVADRTRLDAYTLVNVGLRHQLGPQLQIYVQANNLLDADYEELLSYNAPGRGVYVGLRYALGR